MIYFKEPRIAIRRVVSLFRVFPHIQDLIYNHLHGDTTSTDTCWIWSGPTSVGYPTIRVEWITEVWVVKVCSILYRVYSRRDPQSRIVAWCRNKKCVNPWHFGEKRPSRTPVHSSPNIFGERLFPSSVKQCKRGHPIIGANVLLSKQIVGEKTYKTKRCRICFYVRFEKYHPEANLGRSIRRIEKSLERRAGKKHNWHPDYRGRFKQ